MGLAPRGRIAYPSAEHPVFRLTGNERGAFKRGALQDSLHDDDNEWHSSLHFGQHAPADLATGTEQGTISPHQLEAMIHSNC